MNEKISFQNISDSLAQKTGVSKKVADTFSKAFFDTIVEALYMGEDSIRVKGLGTFKLTEVGSRESVNVSNGERIVISGYKKVSFTPEDSVVDFLNQPNSLESESEKKEIETLITDIESAITEETKVEPKEEKLLVEEAATEEIHIDEAIVVETSEESTPIGQLIDKESSAVEMPTASEESVVLSTENVLAEEKTENSTIEDLIQVPEPKLVEQPQDDFAGIDMLISTPESMEEIRQQYEEAKTKMDTAIVEARKALEEKLRLEKLLQRLEANLVPEKTVEASMEESAPTPDSETETLIFSEPAETPTTVVQTAEFISQPEKSSDEKRFHISHRTKHRLFVAMVLTIFCIIVYFLYKTSSSIESIENVPWGELKTQESLNADRDLYIRNAAERNEKAKKKGTKDATKKASTQNATATKADSLKAKPSTADNQKTTEPAQKPQRPATYKMQKGESLTRISQRFYGTKDSVNAIIRINQFPDPNNVPIGAVIKLP